MTRPNVHISDPAPRSLETQVADIIEGRGDTGIYPEVCTNHAKVVEGQEGVYHVSVCIVRANGNRCLVSRYHFADLDDAHRYADDVESGPYEPVVGYCGQGYDCFDARI